MTKEATTKELRTFGLLVGGIFAILAIGPVVVGRKWHFWPMLPAGALLICGLLWPRGLRSIYRGWMKMGRIMGTINTAIILCVVFYGMIVPIGFFKRLARRDVMRLRFEPEVDTYRVLSLPRSGSHMLRQF